MSLAPGVQLGPYTITGHLGHLGHGGMGVVYTAQDPRLKRQVAIKLPPPDLTRDDTARQRFLQEAKRLPLHDPDANEQLGRLIAVTTSGEVLWERAQRAMFSTATLTTAGGLVFAADADRYIRAYDVSDGEVLWQTRVQAGGQGFPMTYAAGGRQFVAVPVGMGVFLPSGQYMALMPELKRPNAGNGLMVFALPE